MSRCPVVFLLDVDNTLLDDDAIQQDLTRRLEHAFGITCRDQYARILEDLFVEVGYRDYVGALQRYRMRGPPETALSLSCFLIEYPYDDRLFLDALEVLKRLGKLAPTVLLSEGDVVFQARKLARAGLCEAVEGRVLIYASKATLSEDVERNYPAERYVLVDDDLRALEVAKKSWGKRVTTVFARKGDHTGRLRSLRAQSLPDVTITHIGELLGDLPRLWTAPQLIPRSKSRKRVDAVARATAEVS